MTVEGPETTEDAGTQSDTALDSFTTISNMLVFSTSACCRRLAIYLGLVSSRSVHRDCLHEDMEGGATVPLTPTPSLGPSLGQLSVSLNHRGEDAECKRVGRFRPGGAVLAEGLSRP